MERFFYFQYAEPFCVSGVNNEALLRVSSFFLYPQSVVPKPYLLYFYALLNIYDGPETKGDRKYTPVKRVQIQRLMVLFVLDAVKMIKKAPILHKSLQCPKEPCHSFERSSSSWK